VGCLFGDASVGYELRDRRRQSQQHPRRLIAMARAGIITIMRSRSARHGHRWWEIDNTYLTIRFLAWLGLASDVWPTCPAPEIGHPRSAVITGHSPKKTSAAARAEDTRTRRFRLFRLDIDCFID